MIFIVSYHIPMSRPELPRDSTDKMLPPWITMKTNAIKGHERMSCVNYLWIPSAETDILPTHMGQVCTGLQIILLIMPSFLVGGSRALQRIAAARKDVKCIEMSARKIFVGFLWCEHQRK